MQCINVEHELYAEEQALRLNVLLRPIGLSAWWHRDSFARHIVALSDAGSVVGCVLLILPKEDPSQRSSDEAGCVILCQMAVSDAWQRKGVGAILLQGAERLARDAGESTIVLHARESAAEFYVKNGFSEYGERFTEVSCCAPACGHACLNNVLLPRPTDGGSDLRH